MAKAARYIKDTEKGFVRHYDSLCAKHGKWTVWEDFVMISAISISNAVDRENAEEREREFLQRMKKYSDEEKDCLAEMLKELVTAFEENPDQDFLGELFMRLGLSNEHNGQFFTPYHVCHFMAEICCGDELDEKAEETGWVSVNEPTCGSGAMLVAFANVCRQKGVDYQTSVLFVAQDIDYVVACMCYLQMSLLGCPGYVMVGDSLANPLTSIDGRGLIPLPGRNIWYTPFYFREEWQARREAFAMAQLFKELLNASPQQSAPEPLPAAVGTEFSETEFGQLTFL